MAAVIDLLPSEQVSEIGSIGFSQEIARDIKIQVHRRLPGKVRLDAISTLAGDREKADVRRTILDLAGGGVRDPQPGAEGNTGG